MANGHGGARGGAGRPKGALGERTRIAKEAIEQAFENIGGVEALTRWARENEGDFFRVIFPKLIPVQMQHGGDPEGDPIKAVTEIVLRGVRSDDAGH